MAPSAIIVTPDAPVKAVIISECFEDQEPKAKVLEGICSVFDKSVVYGGSTYGSFNQAGVVITESTGQVVWAHRGEVVGDYPPVSQVTEALQTLTQ